MERDDRERRTWMSRAEVARLLHVAPVTVGRWASQGKLAYSMTLGGRRRYWRDDVADLAEELARVTPAAAPRRRPGRR